MTVDRNHASGDFAQMQRLREMLNDVKRIETNLRSLERNMIAIRDGMFKIVTNLRSKNGDPQH
jgi:hypothetical protein